MGAPRSVTSLGVSGSARIWAMMHQLPEQLRLAYTSRIGQDRLGEPTELRHLAERLRGRVFNAVVSGSLLTDLTEMFAWTQQQRKDANYCGAVPTRPPDNTYDN